MPLRRDRSPNPRRGEENGWSTGAGEPADWPAAEGAGPLDWADEGVEWTEPDTVVDPPSDPLEHSPSRGVRRIPRDPAPPDEPRRRPRSGEPPPVPAAEAEAEPSGPGARPSPDEGFEAAGQAEAAAPGDPATGEAVDPGGPAEAAVAHADEVAITDEEPAPHAPPLGERAEATLRELDRTYAEVRAQLAGLLTAAEVDAEAIRTDAQGEAEQIVRRARDEAEHTLADAERIRGAAESEAERVVGEAETQAAERVAELSQEAERMRAEAEEYARDMRLAVDAYATRTRRDAEEEARQTLAKAEARARTVEEAAERRARELEQAARRRHEELHEEARLLEEHRRRVLSGLRDIASQLEEVPLPSDGESGGDERRLRAVDRRR